MRPLQKTLHIHKEKLQHWLETSIYPQLNHLTGWKGEEGIARKCAHWLGGFKAQKTLGAEQRLKAHQRYEQAGQFFSFSDLLSYDLFCEDTNVFINQQSLGWGLQFQPVTGSDEAFVDILTSLLTDVLPAGGQLQCLLWGSPKVGRQLDEITASLSQRGGEFQRLARIQNEHLKRLAHASNKGSKDYRLQDMNVYVFFSLPKSHKEARCSALEQYRSDVMSSLKSIHIQPSVMTPSHLLTVFHNFVSPNEALQFEGRAWDPHNPLSHQLQDVEERVDIHSDYIRFSREANTMEARAFSVKQFPKTVSQWQMGEAIGQLFNSSLQMPCQFLIHWDVHLMKSDAAHHRAQSKAVEQTKKAKNSQILNLFPSIAKEHEDWTFIRNRLGEGDTLVETFFQIILWDRPDCMARQERKVRDLYQSIGWKLQKERYLQLQSYLAAFPMMMSEGLYKDLKQFKRLRTMTAFNAVNIMPLQGEWKGYPEPLMVLPGRRGQLCGWNPFSNNQGNYNFALAAGSGKGKSVFVQYYLTGLLGWGGRAWVIDIGHSYEKTCRILHGEFIAFELDNPICLNFFTAIHSEQAFKANLPMLVPLVASMARQKTDTSEEEDKFIEKAIAEAWAKKANQASVTTIKECLEDYGHPVAENLAHLLTSYAKGGMFADFFEGVSDINFDNPFIVLELLGLKDKKSLQQVVLFALITRIHQAMYLSSRTSYKSCIIDEAWDLLGDGGSNAAKFIETGYRTARRHNGNFGSITQSLNDYFKNDAAKAAFMNADFTVVLGQKSQDIDGLEKTDRFPVDGYIKRVLKSLRMVDKHYSECVIQSPHGLSIHRIILASYLRVLFSSKGKEFERVSELTQQGLSLHDAVTEVVKENEQEP